MERLDLLAAVIAEIVLRILWHLKAATHLIAKRNHSLLDIEVKTHHHPVVALRHAHRTLRPRTLRHRRVKYHPQYQRAKNQGDCRRQEIFEFTEHLRPEQPLHRYEQTLESLHLFYACANPLSFSYLMCSARSPTAPFLFLPPHVEGISTAAVAATKAVAATEMEAVVAAETLHPQLRRPICLQDHLVRRGANKIEEIEVIVPFPNCSSRKRTEYQKRARRSLPTQLNGSASIAAAAAAIQESGRASSPHRTTSTNSEMWWFLHVQNSHKQASNLDLLLTLAKSLSQVVFINLLRAPLPSMKCLTHTLRLWRNK